MLKLLRHLFILGTATLLLHGCKQGEEPPSAGTAHQEMLQRAQERKDAKAAHIEAQNAVRDFQIRYGRLPTNLFEVIKFGIIEKLPATPEGVEYTYNAQLGNVSLKKSEAPAPEPNE